MYVGDYSLESSSDTFFFFFNCSVSFSWKGSKAFHVNLLSSPLHRAGHKLEAAIEEFGIDVSGKVALDSGLSTGGFTDCLLQYGASFIYGVDVGYGQVIYSLLLLVYVCVWS